MNNDLMKKANIESEYTPEQIQDLSKCADDPIYFIEKYIKVQHPTRGTIPFKLYPYQKEMVKSFHKNRFVINKLSRQCGKCVSGNTLISVYSAPTSILKSLILRLIGGQKYSIPEQ